MNPYYNRSVLPILFLVSTTILLLGCQLETTSPMTIGADIPHLTATISATVITQSLVLHSTSTVSTTETVTPILPSPTSHPAENPLPTIAPTLPPKPLALAGWLVFSSIRVDTNGDGDITIGDAWHLYTLELVTGEETAITSGEYNDIHPSWSPDGKQIVFSSNRTDDGSYDLFVVNRDGSDLRQLTAIAEDVRQPVWSPDNEHIAFVMTQILEDGSEHHQIGLYSLNDGHIQQLTYSLDLNENSQQPAWSPDGRYLAFSTREKTLTDSSRYVTNIHLIEIITLDRFKLERDDELIYDAHYPAWIPGEKQIIAWEIPDPHSYMLNLGLFEIEWENYAPTLKQLPITLTNIWGSPVWTTNGDWAIYITSDSSKWRLSEAGGMDDLEIAAAPIDLYSLVANTPPQSEIILDLSDHLYRIFQFLTDNAFIDRYVDWTPQ